MHFWIDKRSAQWGRRGCGKAMVTPVHRFQAVEAVVARSHHQHPRYPRHSSAAPVPAPSARPHTHPHHHGPELDAPVFLDHHHPHLACHGGVVGGGPSLAATGRLKCGMWASFALVTVFMAGAKFYFNTQSTGLEVLVFCALLVIVLFAGCAVSLCEAVTQPPQPQAVGGVSTAAAAAVVMVNSVPSASAASSASVAVTVATPAPVETTVSPEPPPPPYHIAVLLPPPPAPPAPPSPPPTYDKAVTVS